MDRTGKWIVLLVVPLVVIGAFVALRRPAPAPAGPLASIPPEKFARIERYWDGRSPIVRMSEGDHDRTPWPETRLGRAIRATGEDGSRILLRFVLEKGIERFGIARFWADESMEPVASWIAAHPDPRIEPVLRDIVRDRDAPRGRFEAVIALCHEGNAAAVEPLVDVALDPTEDLGLREAILCRIHRIGGPPPIRLRELLYVPYDRLDVTAAAALAAGGDPEATSLLADLLEAPARFGDGELRGLAARGVVRLTGEGAEELAIATAISATDEDRAAALRRAAAYLRGWRAAHPDDVDTDFERARAEYRASKRRRRELETLRRPLAEIARIPEEELDLGAAALAAWPQGRESGPERLEQLDRLVRVVRRDLEGAEDPREILRRIARRLTPEVGSPALPMNQMAKHSWLGVPIAEGWGDDVSLSTLWLAVGERLGLPLRGAKAEHRMLVARDDGERRLVCDPLEFGKLRDARSAAERLTKREVLAENLSRSARFTFARHGHEWALAAANAALQIRPADADLIRIRALAGFELASVPDEEVLAGLRQARDISDPTGASPTIAGVLDRAGRHREALAEWELVLREEPEDLFARIAHARDRLLLGDREAALAEADAIVKSAPDAPAAARLRLELLARVRDPAWRDGLAGVADPEETPEPFLVVADALLDGGGKHEPDVVAAREALTGVAFLGDGENGNTLTVVGSGDTQEKVTTAITTSVEDEVRAHFLRLFAPLATGWSRGTRSDFRARYQFLLARAALLDGDRDEARRRLGLAEKAGGATRESRLFRRRLAR